jgi:TPR repeat protein
LIFLRNTAFQLALRLTMRHILATLAVVGALLFSAGSAWADFDDGVAAAQRGDYATAFREFLPLAEQGHTIAQHLLGVMYNFGEGVPKNDAEAVKWYRKAAEQGHAPAQYNLGNMYGKGEGVPVNNVRAYMWWSLAKAQGSESAATNLDIVKKRMTPADISKAQALASEWWEKHNN